MFSNSWWGHDPSNIAQDGKETIKRPVQDGKDTIPLRCGDHVKRHDLKWKLYDLKSTSEESRDQHTIINKPQASLNSVRFLHPLQHQKKQSKMIRQPHQYDNICDTLEWQYTTGTPITLPPYSEVLLEVLEAPNKSEEVQIESNNVNQKDLHYFVLVQEISDIT